MFFGCNNLILEHICSLFLFSLQENRKTLKPNPGWLNVLKDEGDTAGRGSWHEVDGNGRSALSEKRKLALDDPHAPEMVKMDISAIA